MKLYVSGPMSDMPDLNFPAFAAETARLRALGFEVVSPAELDCDHGADWADCMFNDLRALCDCGGIVLLQGWEASPGAQIERLWAVRTGKTVFRAGDLQEAVCVA